MYTPNSWRPVFRIKGLTKRDKTPLVARVATMLASDWTNVDFNSERNVH